MARGIVLNLGGEVSSFSFTKVERDKLYGRKERVILDEQGQRCVSVHLTADGSALIPPGSTAYLYLDEQQDTVERSELKGVDAEGRPLPVIPSTLGVEVPLTGPMDPGRVLDHVATSVYQLSPEALGEQLRAALARGQIFEFRFNYRDDFADTPAFLLENDQGLFVLVATPVDFPFVARTPPLILPEEEGETLGEELDFGMM